MKKIDAKLIIWIATIVFIAGGGWWNLQSVSTDVQTIQETLDEQESDITIHVSSDGHPSGEERMERIETSHTEMRDDIRTMMVNQSAICQATGARCR
jgi:hypothetical protein